MIKFSCTNAERKDEEVGKQAVCQMVSDMTRTDQSAAVPDVSLVKATRFLTRHGCLYNEVFVVGKQFSGVLFY